MRITLTLALAAVFTAPALALQDASGMTAEPVVETPTAVMAMLGDVESHLYQPAKHGLRSLSFELKVEDPLMGLGHIATATASWSVEAGSDVSVVVHDFEIPAAVAAMAGVDESQLVQMKEAIRSGLPAQVSMQMEGIFDNILNTSVTSMRKDYLGSMAGASEDGLVKLKLEKRPGANASVAEQTLYIDDEAVIRRVQTLQDMGMGPKPMTVDMNWVPVDGQAGDLILKSRSAKVQVPSPFGGEMEHTIEESFGYIEVEGITIMNSVTSSSFMGPPQVLTLEKLVVNGKAVAADAPAEG